MRSMYFIATCVIVDGFQTSEMGDGFGIAKGILFLIFFAMDAYELNGRDK